MSGFLDEKTILVTGGTGSFGHQIVDDILVRFKPKEIRIFSRGEDKQYKMKLEYQNKGPLRFFIGDVRDFAAVSKVMDGVKAVFHAAALKQVPLCEENVFEAVQTNILGAENIIRASLDFNVDFVVGVSTDKAVEPVNVMGMSKAIQERLLISANLLRNDKKTRFICVRYGNVLGSTGSVVPLFKSQIEQGKPITVTDFSMTRFILTLPQAIDLVFYAAEQGVGGEVFVRKMPAHAIGDLVMVMLEGLKPASSEIRQVGVRPGEKIHETLVSPTESIRAIEKEDYFIILPQIKIPEIEVKYSDFQAKQAFRYSSDTTKGLSKIELAEFLHQNGWI